MGKKTIEYHLFRELGYNPALFIGMISEENKKYFGKTNKHGYLLDENGKSTGILLHDYERLKFQNNENIDIMISTNKSGGVGTRLDNFLCKFISGGHFENV